MVGVYQHAQRTQRGDLFALREVPGHVFGDLATGQRSRADLGLFAAQILDDLYQPVAADQPADIQLSVCAERQIGVRILYVAANIAAPVADGEYPPGGTPAVDGQRQGIGLLTQHTAHHGGDRQRAPQRGGCRWGRSVAAYGAVYDVG